jgi:mRNA interferase RelE/StbE
MALDVRITETARDSLADLEVQPRERIVRKLSDVEDFPEHYLDRLTNLPGYALRVGDFRVILDWDREENVLYVVAVLERKHDYRELPGLGEVWGTWRE